MLALREAGVVDRLYGPLFRELFGRGGCAYVPTQYPDVHVVARAARASGGVVVLAHPGEYRSLELLRYMAQNGEVDGAEYWHPRNTADDQEEIAALKTQISLLTDHVASLKEAVRTKEEMISMLKRKSSKTD